MTDCVPALPASILALSDVAFPICSSFRHGISPFRNEQYRNQEGKAIRKSNCYQKVIICLAVTSAPNLCLLRRNFCAAGGVLFSYSGAILERLRNPFIDYSGAKYARLALPVLRDVITSISFRNGHKAPPKSLGHLRLREPRRQPL